MKEQNIISKVLSILLSILLVLSSFYLLYELIKINVLPTKLLFLMTIVFVLLDAIFILLLCHYTKRIVSKIICILITLVLVLGLCLGGFYISKTGSLLTSITNVTKHAKNTVSVVVKQSSDIKNKSQLNGVSVGTLRNIGVQGSKKALKELSNKGIVLEQKEYDSLSALLEGFYNGEVESIIIN